MKNLKTWILGALFINTTAIAGVGESANIDQQMDEQLIRKAILETHYQLQQLHHVMQKMNPQKLRPLFEKQNDKEMLTWLGQLQETPKTKMHQKELWVKIPGGVIRIPVTYAVNHKLYVDDKPVIVHGFESTEELKKKIALALKQKTSWFNLFITPAYAEVTDSKVVAYIMRFLIAADKLESGRIWTDEEQASRNIAQIFNEVEKERVRCQESALHVAEGGSVTETELWDKASQIEKMSIDKDMVDDYLKELPNPNNEGVCERLVDGLYTMAEESELEVKQYTKQQLAEAKTREEAVSGSGFKRMKPESLGKVEMKDQRCGSLRQLKACINFTIADTSLHNKRDRRKKFSEFGTQKVEYAPMILQK